jgi:hypothetical protein
MYLFYLGITDGDIPGHYYYLLLTGKARVKEKTYMKVSV